MGPFNPCVRLGQELATKRATLELVYRELLAYQTKLMDADAPASRLGLLID